MKINETFTEESLRQVFIKAAKLGAFKSPRKQVLIEMSPELYNTCTGFATFEYSGAFLVGEYQLHLTVNGDLEDELVVYKQKLNEVTLDQAGWEKIDI